MERKPEAPREQNIQKPQKLHEQPFLLESEIAYVIKNYRPDQRAELEKGLKKFDVRMLWHALQVARRNSCSLQGKFLLSSIFKALLERLAQDGFSWEEIEKSLHESYFFEHFKQVPFLKIDQDAYRSCNYTLLRDFNQVPSVVTAAGLSSDGTRALIGCHDGTILIMDTQTGRCLQKCNGHSGPVTSVVFGLRDQVVLTTSLDGSARLWNTANGACLRGFRHKVPVCEGSFSRDEKSIITRCDRTVQIWDVQTQKCQRRLVFEGADNNGYAWDAQTQVFLKISSQEVLVGHAVLSPTRKFALTTSGHVATLWDTGSGKVVQEFSHDDPVTSSVFGPSDGIILTTSCAGMVKIWDVKTGCCVQDLLHDGASQVSCCCDSGTILTFGDKGLKIWHWQAPTIMVTRPMGTLLLKKTVLCNNKLQGLLRDFINRKHAHLCELTCPICLKPLAMDGYFSGLSQTVRFDKLERVGNLAVLGCAQKKAHAFCFSCLKELVEARRRKQPLGTFFSCPLCQKEWTFEAFTKTLKE